MPLAVACAFLLLSPSCVRAPSPGDLPAQSAAEETMPEERVTIPLITGDVVIISETPEGERSFVMEDGVNFSASEVDGNTYLIPEGVDLGKLDMDFFNIDYLMRENYHKLPYLPVLITYRSDLSPSEVEVLVGRIKTEARAEDVEDFPFIHTIAARLPVENLRDAYQALVRMEEIEKISLSRKVHLFQQ